MPNHPEQETAIVVATDILLRSIAVIINASRVSAIALFLSAMNTEQLKARPSEFKQFAKKTLFPKGPPPLHWLRLGLCWSKARNSNVSQGKVAKTLTGGKMLEEPPLPESATVHIFQPGSGSTSTVANLDTLKVFDFPKER